MFILSHFGCVNAVEFSADGAWIVSGGDDRYGLPVFLSCDLLTLSSQSREPLNLPTLSLCLFFDKVEGPIISSEATL